MLRQDDRISFPALLSAPEAMWESPLHSQRSFSSPRIIALWLYVGHCLGRFDSYSSRMLFPLPSAPAVKASPIAALTTEGIVCFLLCL